MPDTSTEVAIATTTLTGSGLVTFSSIPSTYTDLRLVFTNIGSANGQATYLRFNSDSGTNYSYTDLYSNGTVAGTVNNVNLTNIPISYAGTSTTIPRLYTYDIFSYAGSTNKTSLITVSDNNNNSGFTARIVGLWRSTSAINSISLYLSGSGTYAAGTTATLYGIL